ncbi:PdaC/SigV domain-containing protein [Algibacter luteus]|uniref:Deacetylase PdaC domain-containing protein n=1 Tax=Algibacter luteus TaxID=1178825 RepID=A0A1M6D295_9FLAO|nr:DUF4163 domain-containing protein [Algibacter luteus]SHI67118.1 protein of unknown function [Algibacter luteus]
MNHSKITVLIWCFLILFSCKEEQKITFTDVNISSENNSIVVVNIPEAIGNSTIADRINSEIEQTIISELHIGNRDDITSNSIKEGILNFNNEYQSFVKNFPESESIWEAQIDGEVMYQSSEVISIALTTFINTGGATGILNITFLNFESESGKRLENNQLINNLKAFKTLAVPYFNDAIADQDVPLDAIQFKLPANIGYSEDGLVLLYNIQDLSPYLNDILEFAIPFEVVQDILVYNSL